MGIDEDGGLMLAIDYGLSLFIGLFVIAVYWRSNKLFLCVDDLSHYKNIQNGIFGVKQRYPLQWLALRLYSGGTFAWVKKCKKCLGSKKVKVIGEGEDKEAECKSCNKNGDVWKVNVKWDHFFTTVIYAVLCILIYWAFKPLGGKATAFTAAILYACNPVNNQVSIWLNGRRYAIVIILVLLMVILVNNFGLLGSLTAGAIYLLIPVFQISGIFAPVLIMWKYPWIIGCLSAALLIFRGVIRKKIRIRYKKIYDSQRREWKWNRLIVSVKFFGNYFFRMFWPGVTLMIYPFLHSWGVTEEGNKEAYKIDKYFWKGIAAISLLLCSATACFINGLFIETCFLVFLLMSILQWCALIPVTQELADRYVSLPCVFGMYFISRILIKWMPMLMSKLNMLISDLSILMSKLNFTDWTLIGYVLIAFQIGHYLSRLDITYKMYNNIEDYWNYQCFFAPGIPLPRAFKIDFLLKTNDVTKAWIETREGLRHCPNSFEMLKYAMICSNMVGETEASRHYMAQARLNIPLGQEDARKWQLDDFLSTIEKTEKIIQLQTGRHPSQQTMNRHQRRAQKAMERK